MCHEDKEPRLRGACPHPGGQATVLSEQVRLEVALSDAGVREQDGLPQVLHCRWTQTWASAEGESFIAWQPIQRWMPTPSTWWGVWWWAGWGRRDLLTAPHLQKLPHPLLPSMS